MDKAQPTRVRITRIFCTNKKKDGTEIRDSYGKTKWRVVLQTQEHGSEWLTGFFYFEPRWEEGDQIDIAYWEEESEYNGEKRKQKFFKLPVKEDRVAQLLERVLVNQTKHGLILQQILSHFPEIAKSEIEPEVDLRISPENYDLNTDDIPF